VKKLDMILDAMSIAKQKGIFYNCTFIGNGEDRELLESKVDSYGLSKQVWFYGACYDEAELSKMIYNADLCVAPGNVGLTAMHSLVYGCPIITHNNFPYQMPEFEAIVPNKTGLFFDFDSAESLYKTINSWFSLDLERDDVRQMAYDEIDSHWNPRVQIDVLKKIIK
jgi:glycosyltransferase involved in cell wall biosynthesis